MSERMKGRAGADYGRSIAVEEGNMPKASTPEDTGRLIGEAITFADMDAALSLYEPDATFALPKGFGEGSVTGRDALHEAFGGLLALTLELTVNAEKALVSGDTALVIATWMLKGRDPGGNHGYRRPVCGCRPPQSDGSWLFVIDNPNASD